MSYVRWSTRVREKCATCGGSGRVPMDHAEKDSSAYVLTGGVRLCRDCTSCWYIYWSVGDFIQLDHAGCPELDDESAKLDFEDAEGWKAPEGCPMADVAEDAVRRAVKDWKEREKAK